MFNKIIEATNNINFFDTKSRHYYATLQTDVAEIAEFSAKLFRSLKVVIADVETCTRRF